MKKVSPRKGKTLGSFINFLFKKFKLFKLIFYKKIAPPIWFSLKKLALDSSAEWICERVKKACVIHHRISCVFPRMNHIRNSSFIRKCGAILIENWIIESIDAPNLARLSITQISFMSFPLDFLIFNMTSLSCKLYMKKFRTHAPAVNFNINCNTGINAN